MNFHRFACAFFIHLFAIRPVRLLKNDSAYMQPSLFLYNRPFPFD